MKTIITLITTTMLFASVTSAMASDRQATDDALTTAISAQAAHAFGDAMASARVSGAASRSQDDFQLQGR